jgi:arylsulfatase A-like enzyme
LVYEGYVDDLVAERAIQWLRQKRAKPFCLILWFQSPHAPFFRARRYLDLYRGVTIPKPATFDDDLKGYSGKPRAFADADNKIGGPYVKDSETQDNCARTLEEIVKDYYAGVADVDDNLGKVFQALIEMGQFDDTVMMFSSDHGFFLGEWRMYDKRLMHEPSIRTPMLVRYPRLIQAGSSARQMVLNTDIAPTLLDLAGLKIPAWIQGQSLVPLLKGEEPMSWRKDWLYEYYEYPGPHNVRKNRGVRSEQFKLIHYYEDPQEFELYDLKEDPGELNNLYADPRYATLARDLRQRISELREETDDHYIGA